MPTRSEVYEAIDTERAYQSTLKRKGVPTLLAQNKERHWAVDLLTITKICRDLEEHCYNNSGTPPMDYFRKIAAVAVHAMEQGGAPKRELQ